MTSDKHRQGVGQLYRELADLGIRLAEAEANARRRRDEAAEESGAPQAVAR
jgi:chromosome condensin MukBEF ATPase and DNA-binding subunit MukB